MDRNGEYPKMISKVCMAAGQKGKEKAAGSSHNINGDINQKGFGGMN